MRAILLAGGKGTRLRPLTLHTPKPIVPIFDRPFLQYQIDLLRQVPEIDEVVLSLNYQPGRIEEVFGDGAAAGVRLEYMVEPTPLGTGGAIKFAAGRDRGEPLVVFNGDVLTAVDLPQVIALHRQRRARATIVLTPVDNPSAYGLVETDASGNVRAFLEKPSADEIRCDTINAGIYVLESRLLDLIPPGVNHSIERGFFPALLRRGDLVRAHVHRGYWIDIGTPEKYRQVHRDILSGRFPVELYGARTAQGWVHPEASLDPGATVTGPVYVGPRCQVAAGARIGPGAVLVSDVAVGSGAEVKESVVWPGAALAESSRVDDCVLGPGVRVGAFAVARAATLGEGTVLSPYSRLEGA
jgi:NDP-sugar pyrophosphorylase family protein